MSHVAYVWVAGHSAVGKRTLIDTILSNPDEWASRLEIREIVSARFISGDAGIESIELAGNSSGCALIHWQRRSHDSVKEVQRRNPKARHIVIHVSREVGEHKQIFEAENKGVQYDDKGHLGNVLAIESSRPYVDAFIDVANINRTFTVIGRTYNMR